MLFKKGLLSGLIMLVVGGSVSVAANGYGAFAGQDLHLSGTDVISYNLDTGEHTLVFENGFTAGFGANRFKSDKAVIWLTTSEIDIRGRRRTEYKATLYLEQNVSVSKAGLSRTTNIAQTTLEGGESLLVRFDVTGEVFVTAEKKTISNPHRMELYRTGLSWAERTDAGPKFIVQANALVPELPERATPTQEVVTESGKPFIPPEEKEPSLLQKILAPPSEVAAIPPQPKEPKFSYPVVFAPAGAEPLKIDSAPAREGTNVATIRQRFYASQRLDEQGRLLELQADSAVIFYSGSSEDKEKDGSDIEDILSKANVQGIYLTGDVVMAEGQRTIRADEIFYDFERKKAIAINAEIRNFDSGRGIPVYVRAAKIRQLAENKFSANDIVLTTSEFYLPQVSIEASSVVITDRTTVDEQIEKLADHSYDAELKDVAVKFGNSTVFRWPGMRSNLQRPDIPLQSLHVGHDNTFGTSIETRWFLARLLGLKESPGTKSSLFIDYFGKRGLGTGAEIEYIRDDHFGSMYGYIINDHGDDKIGRNSTRDNLEPPRELRGRFEWSHRQFLDDDWELTFGVDYISDEHFLEQFSRDEFNLSDRETYIHLKRSRDNWAFSVLGKARLNDFYEEIEELPTVEFHLTGESLFNDRFTVYSDTQASHYRQRIGNEHALLLVPQRGFSFLSHRTEIDMPLWMKPFKVVPYAAGWLGYGDRGGDYGPVLPSPFATNLDHQGAYWIGEAGVRISTQLWKVYPNVKSRLWDLNGLRHIIEPFAVATIFEEGSHGNLGVEQKDSLHLGVSQRWQTKRGPADNQRTVDWMRLDLDATFLNGNESVSQAGPGPDRFIWSNPSVPLRVFSIPEIFNGDLIEPAPAVASLATRERFGPQRDYFGADYIWRVSDTTAILADAYYDARSGVINQMNVGFSRLVWPNLSYYIGSRYLRRVAVLGEQGSNAVTFALTYELDPRYTLILAQQYDLDYGANVRSDVTVIRRYHRMYWGLTFSSDQSLKEQSVVFSLWPQGIPEMALGHTRTAKTMTVPAY